MASSDRGLNITDLPPEIHTMILNSCPYHTRITSLFAKAATYSDISPWTRQPSYSTPNQPGTLPYRVQTVSHATPATRYPWRTISLTQNSAARGGRLATTRICLLCARANNVIRPGDPVMYQRRIHHLCLTCGESCSFYFSPFTFRCYPVPMTCQHTGPHRLSNGRAITTFGSIGQRLLQVCVSCTALVLRNCAHAENG